MLSSIFWGFILTCTVFTFSVFKAPDLADNISETIGLPNLAQNIREFKNSLDSMVTNLPSKEELKDTYESTKSGAIKLKDGLVSGIEVTKDKVDGVRETLSGAEQKIEDAKDAYNKTVDFLEESGKKLQEVQQTIDNTTKVIEDIQNIGDTTTNN